MLSVKNLANKDSRSLHNQDTNICEIWSPKQQVPADSMRHVYRNSSPNRQRIVCILYNLRVQQLSISN